MVMCEASRCVTAKEPPHSSSVPKCDDAVVAISGWTTDKNPVIAETRIPKALPRFWTLLPPTAQA